MEDSHFYHCCTRGLKVDTLFATEAEFVAGMNRIAVCVITCKKEKRTIVVVAFCLMSNHVHFILHGTQDNCLFFMKKYRQLSGIWISNHRDCKLRESMEIGLWMLSDKDKLREKIIYVLRNPIPAGINLTPHGYRWSSGGLMFADNAYLLDYTKMVSEFSARELSRKFATIIKLPDHWHVGPEGMIWPGDYTNFKVAERQFKNVQDFMFMINQSRLDKEGNREEMEDFVSVPDGDVRLRATEIAERLFDKTAIRYCSASERIDIAKIVRAEFKCNHKQLARILHMDAENLKTLV